MCCTSALPAPPSPATASFTSFGLYCTTGTPARPARASASPLACPTDIAVRVFTWNRTRSTAIAWGASSSMSDSSSRCNAASRSGSGSAGGVRITPYATARKVPPSRVIAPYPQHDTPGSMPSTTSRGGGSRGASLGSNTGSIVRGAPPRTVDGAPGLGAGLLSCSSGPCGASGACGARAG